MIMDDVLRVFSIDASGFQLRTLLGAVTSAGHPAAVSTGIAGSASEQELDSENWDAVLLRWTEPELHDVALVERDLTANWEEARSIIETSLRDVANSNDPGGQLIVSDHLRRCAAVYSVQILPALIDDDEHAAWAAIDIVLRCIAAQTDGIIAVPCEGYCDAEGELLLAENEAEAGMEIEEIEEEPEQA